MGGWFAGAVGLALWIIAPILLLACIVIGISNPVGGWAGLLFVYLCLRWIWRTAHQLPQQVAKPRTIKEEPAEWRDLPFK
jgi:hypothetical protein